MVKTSYTVTRFDVGYQGFYVEVAPITFGECDMIAFILCNEEHDVRIEMCGCVKEDAPESAWEQIILHEMMYCDHFSEYWTAVAAVENALDETSTDDYDEDAADDVECDCCGKCENVMEAVDMHNKHVEDMQDLAEALLKQYPNIENTDVNDVFCKAFDSMKGPAIFLCCEMNEFEEDQGWMVTDDGYVVHADECVCNGDCANCPMED